MKTIPAGINPGRIGQIPL